MTLIADPTLAHGVLETLARSADAAFAVSAELRDHLIGEGFDGRSVGVIYNAGESNSVFLIDAEKVAIHTHLAEGPQESHQDPRQERVEEDRREA